MNETLNYFVNYGSAESAQLDDENKVETQMGALEQIIVSNATKHVTYVEFSENGRQAVLMVAWGVELGSVEGSSSLSSQAVIQWIRLVANNPVTGEVDEMEIEEHDRRVRAMWNLANDAVRREFESSSY